MRGDGVGQVMRERTDGSSFASKVDLAIWPAVAAILAAGVGFSWNPTPMAQLLAALFVACGIVHAVISYGSRAALVFFAMSVAVGFVMENIGVTTGFPFGRYHFEIGADLANVGRIPLVVGPMWFAAGYFSWVVAATLLGGVDRRLDRRFNLVVLPVVAAFVTAQWDLVVDPPSSTIAKAWIWHEGGAVFGVPPSNFFGWLLTSWLFLQGFALYLHRRNDPVRPDQVADRKLRLIGILFYVCGGITHVVPWLLGQSGDIVDAASQSWRLQDIRGATVVIMVFTMFFTSLLALIRLLDGADPDQRPRPNN